MEIGIVVNYFDKVGVAAVKLLGQMKVGDKVTIKGGEVEFEQVIESMQIERVEVEKANAGDEVGIKVVQKVRSGYKVTKN